MDVMFFLIIWAQTWKATCCFAQK